MRVSWNYGRGLVAFTAAILVLQGASNAIAQFAPLGNQQQAYPQNQQQAYPSNQTQAYSAYPSQGYLPNQALPQVQAAQPSQPVYQNQTVPQQTLLQNQAVARYPGAPQQQLQSQVGPQYTAIAMLQGSLPAGQVPSEAMLAPVPEGGYPAQTQTAPAAMNYSQSAPVQSPYSSGYGCNTGGCNTGGCDTGGYNTFGNTFLSGRRGCGRRWFGGFYGLYMERSGNTRVPLGYTTTMPSWGNYATDAEIGLTTQDVDTGFQTGAEVRFGSTLGLGGGCGPVWGWEVAYWGLNEETSVARLDDMATFGTDGNRTYSMIDFRGLEVNMGSGYRPVNSYFDTGLPQADHTNDPGFVGVDVEIRSLVARSTFSTQSVELNLLRLPMFGGGVVGGGSCGGGSCGAGGCASGGSGNRTAGFGGRRALGGFAPFVGPRHSMTTLAGFRFMRFDEDFSLRSNVDLVSGGTVVGSEFIAYNVEADNRLFGFQLGCNGIYRLGCQGRWALRYGSSFGIYGNRMEVSQRMDIPSTGIATRYANGAQSNFDINSTKDDVAFLGELRLGGSYQYSSNWRLYGGWRALAVSGVALTSGQIPTAFMTPGQVGYINSTGSMFLHGLQTGIECTY